VTIDLLGACELRHLQLRERSLQPSLGEEEWRNHYHDAPLEVVARAGGRASVVVPGYRRTRVDFTWAERKTLLRKL
jgi:hypothetical protein